MTEHDGFWAAIQARPEDSLPVLIFADRLDELGDGLGETLRLCANAGTRPGTFPGGGSFWVTTTALPVAAQNVRQGRRTVTQPIRHQPSWLSAVYFRVLAAERQDAPLIRSATVWRCASVRVAYEELHRCRLELRRQLYDPETGRHRFMGVTGSSWRDESRRAIAVALAALPVAADDKAKRRALRDAYPFGPKKNHPYKCWLAEVRRALAVPPKKAEQFPFGACEWCYGAGCIACAAKRLREEAGYA